MADLGANKRYHSTLPLIPIINHATITDLRQVIDLERRSFEKQDWCSPWSFITSFVSPSSQLLVAKYGPWVAGHMLIFSDCDYDYANEIFTIAVGLPFRRRGVAELLIETYAREYADKPVLTLQVRKSNVTAQALYKKLGFEFSEVLEGAYPDGENGWIYLKRFEDEK